MIQYTLKEGDCLTIGDHVKITVIEIYEDNYMGDGVVVGIDAPGIDIKRGNCKRG